MPNFHEVYLGDLCTFTQGVQIADKDTLKTLQQGYIRYIYIRDLFTDKYPVYVKDKYPKKLLYQGDIVMVNTGNTSGSVYQAKEGVLCNNAFKISVRETKHKLLVKEFLWVYLNSNAREQMLKRLFNPAGQPHVGHKNIARLKIKLPPLPEQRKIAKILSTWDKAITTTEKLITTSQQQKKSLMQQLLTGKKRLVRSPEKKGETGMVFEGDWEEVKVSSLGTIYSGGTPSTSIKEFWDGGIDWITPTDITKQNSVYINSSVRKISQEGLKNSSAKLVPKGALLICTRATIGEMAITSHEMCTNQGFKNIVPNKKTNIEFVYYLLTYKKHKLVSKSSGSTFLELSKSAFESMLFKVPEIVEQQKIASVLTAADKEIALLQAKLAFLKQEKKALMQQLLTGKKRVSLSS